MGLKELVRQRLDITMTTYEDVAGKGKTQVVFSDVDVETATQYAAADADMTFRLKELFEPELKEKELWPLFENIEMPLQLVLSVMERNGVVLDVGYLRSLENEFGAEIKRLEAKVHELAGCTFNVN